MNIKYTATSDFRPFIRAINGPLHDGADIEAYHDAWAEYDNELDRFAGLAFDWMQKGTVTLDVESDGEEAGVYELDHDGLKTKREHSNYTIPVRDEEDLSDWICYIDGTLTLTCEG